MSTLYDAAFLRACCRRVSSAEPCVASGRVCAQIGAVIEAEGLPVRVGSVCAVDPGTGEPAFESEVIGFRGKRFLLMPLAQPIGLGPLASIRLTHREPTGPPAEDCLGRILDGLGRPIDAGPPIRCSVPISLTCSPTCSLARTPIRRALNLGIRAINTFVTAGQGVRLGLFAGSGIGKSLLLGQIARFTGAEVNVVALIGERGREVREFVEGELGDALERSVVVVSTADELPLLRRRAAQLATAIAGDFRAKGRHALLLMDSLTRFCTAQREVGLAAGEPPTTRGYPPSVWSELPKLLERAGNGPGPGSVTGIYTVLVEGDDLLDPVADAARAHLDGHIVLARQLAERGHYPAIDVLASVSRVMPDVVSAEHLALARRARRLLATYRDAEDLISIGAYVAGTNAAIDEAQRLREPLCAFLRQGRDEGTAIAESFERLRTALNGGQV